MVSRIYFNCYNIKTKNKFLSDVFIVCDKYLFYYIQALSTNLNLHSIYILLTQYSTFPFKYF